MTSPYNHIRRVRRMAGELEETHPCDVQVLTALREAGFDFPDAEEITNEERFQFVSMRTLYGVYQAYHSTARVSMALRPPLLTLSQFGAALRWLWPHLKDQNCQRWLGPYDREWGFRGVRGPVVHPLYSKSGRPWPKKDARDVPPVD